MDVVYLALGAALLYAGGEGLLLGALGLARRFGMSPLFAGLTVVSLGTSSPELAATLVAAVQGAPEIALGNVVGSNIANVGLVLGLTVLVRRVAASGRLVRREYPFMLLTSLGLFWVVRDGVIGHVEGLVMVSVLTVAMLFLVKWDSTEEHEAPEPPPIQAASAWRGLLFVVGGGALLVGGAHLLVQGAIGIAQTMGISERVIGLTAVAFGTSLPELASSLVAAVRGHGDVVFGNIVGSNFFNILLILGTTALVHPIEVETATLWPHLGVMLGMSLLPLPALQARSEMGVRSGILLVSCYAAYLIFLFA